MTPSIGRIIRVMHEGHPAAAMITGIRANGDLDATVFPAGAVPYTRSELKDGEWAWPPRDDAKPAKASKEPVADDDDKKS